MMMMTVLHGLALLLRTAHDCSVAVAIMHCLLNDKIVTKSNLINYYSIYFLLKNAQAILHFIVQFKYMLILLVSPLNVCISVWNIHSKHIWHESKLLILLFIIQHSPMGIERLPSNYKFLFSLDGAGSRTTHKRHSLFRWFLWLTF